MLLQCTSLKEDPPIIIAKADKGDMVVVLDSAHYFSLGAKHLAAARTYEFSRLIPPKKLLGGITNTSGDALMMECWMITSSVV